jgi:hypothetical protein
LDQAVGLKSQADMIQLANRSTRRWLLCATMAMAVLCPALSVWGDDGNQWQDEEFLKLDNPLQEQGWLLEVPATILTNLVPGLAQVALYPGSAAVTEGSEFLVPVLTAGFSNVQSARFTLAWDPAVLECVATERWGLPGLGPVGFAQPAPGRLTFSWSHPSLGAAGLGPNTPLFVARFRALGALGISSPLRVSSDPVPLEVITAQGRAMGAAAGQGTVEVVRGFEVAGAVSYRDSGVAVGEFAWQLAGDRTSALEVGLAEGNRLRAGVPARGSFRLGVAKTTDTAPLRGVSSIDLVFIRRHILGLLPIGSPLGQLAADTDGSGAITTVDLALLRRLILGQSASLPAGAWRFVPSSHVFAGGGPPGNAPRERTYENLDGPRTGEDFLGVKLGDVDGSWAAAAPAVRRDGDPAVLALTSVRAGVTGSVTLAMVVTNFTAAQALQFSLTWDPSRLTYQGWTAGALPGLGAGNFGDRGAASGRLTFSWDDTSGNEAGLSDGATLVYLHFTAGWVPGMAAVAFTDEPTPREFVRSLAAEKPLTLDGQVEVVDLAAARLETDSVKGRVTLVFPRPSQPGYVIEYSDDLATWQAVREPQVIVEGETVRWTDDGSQTSAPAGRRFYRVVSH